jgi:hypothetical protein
MRRGVSSGAGLGSLRSSSATQISAVVNVDEARNASSEVGGCRRGIDPRRHCLAARRS